MKFLTLLTISILLLFSCTNDHSKFTGKYRLEVSGMKNVTSGELEIVGEPGDYFGKLVFQSKKERVFEIGLNYQSNDSLDFFLPGKGGYLRLKKGNDSWILLI